MNPQWVITATSRRSARWSVLTRKATQRSARLASVSSGSPHQSSSRWLKSRSGQSALSCAARRAEIAGEHAALAHQRLDRDPEVERAGDDRRGLERAPVGARDQPRDARRGELAARAARPGGDRRSVSAGSGMPGSIRVREKCRFHSDSAWRTRIIACRPSRRAAAAGRPDRPPRTRRPAPAAARRAGVRPAARPGAHHVALEVAADPAVEEGAHRRQQQQRAAGVGDEARRQQQRARDQQAQALEHLGDRHHALLELALRAGQHGEALLAQHHRADHRGQHDQRQRRHHADASCRPGSAPRSPPAARG